MRFFFFLCLCSCLSAIERKNIPIHHEATHILSFYIQKDFSDGSLTTRFLNEMKTIFGVDLFVETGTQLGNTAAKASQIFKTVHTIEVFPEFYSRAAERFKNTNNLHLYLGDSGEILDSLLPPCSERAFFYLDGHYDGGWSGRGVKNTPILKELAAIKTWGRGDSVILIDDIADFQESLYPEKIRASCFEDYPSLKELIDEILLINPDYQICFIPNALLAFPPSDNVAVSKVLSACNIDRLSLISDLFSEEELFCAEKTISSVQGAEKRELKLYFDAYWEFERNLGWRSFAGLWMGLILSYEQNPMADQIFQKTAESSLPGWRIDFFLGTHECIRSRIRP